MANRLDIRIEGVSLDLYPDAEEKFYLTLVENDLSDPETRNGSYTKRLRIPNSPNNAELFGFPSFVSSHQSSLYQIREVEILVDGIPLIDGAEMILVQTSADEFELSILGRSSAFFSKLSEEGINSLDWSDLDFTLSKSFVTTHMSNTPPADTWQNKLCTPNVDYYDWDSQKLYDGAYPTDYTTRLVGAYNIKYSGFALYIKEILTRVVAATGYTLDTAGVTFSNFAKLVLVCPITKWVSLPIASVITGSQESTGLQAQWGLYEEHDPVRLAFDTEDATPNKVTWSLTNDEYTITGAGTAVLSLEGTVDFFSVTNPARTSYIAIKKNGNLVVQQQFVGTGDEGVQSFSLISGTVTCEVGDIFHAELYASSKSGGDTGEYLELQSGAFFKIEEESPTNYDITVSKWVPDTPQKLFFLNILKMLNLLVTVNIVERKVYIKDFDSIFDTEPLDISAYIDYTKSPDIRYSFGKLATKNNFGYANDDDVLREDANSVYTSSQPGLDTLTDFLTIEGMSASDYSTFRSNVAGSQRIRVPAFKLTQIAAEGYLYGPSGTVNFQIYTGPTAGTPLKKGGDLAQYDMLMPLNFTNYLPYVIATITAAKNTLTSYVAKDANIDHEFEAWRVELGSDPSPRIGVLVASAASDVRVWDGQDALSSSGVAYPYEVQFTSDITFPTLLANEYKNLMSILDYPVVMNIWAHLPAALIQSLDLTRLVYIAKYNGLFYVNKVNQWKASTLTRLELIHINLENLTL